VATIKPSSPGRSWLTLVGLRGVNPTLDGLLGQTGHLPVPGLNHLLEVGSIAVAQLLDARHYERAYDVRRETFGVDHPDTLTSASNLALNLSWLGEYQRAPAFDEDTLTRRRRILGEDAPDTLTSASQLAFHLSMLGNFADARELQEDVLSRRRRIFGDDPSDTL
jgi:hypothetical protein